MEMEMFVQVAYNGEQKRYVDGEAIWINPAHVVHIKAHEDRHVTVLQMVWPVNIVLVRGTAMQTANAISNAMSIADDIARGRAR